MRALSRSDGVGRDQDAFGTCAATPRTCGVRFVDAHAMVIRQRHKVAVGRARLSPVIFRLSRIENTDKHVGRFNSRRATYTPSANQTNGSQGFGRRNPQLFETKEIIPPYPYPLVLRRPAQVSSILAPAHHTPSTYVYYASIHHGRHDRLPRPGASPVKLRRARRLPQDLGKKREFYESVKDGGEGRAVSGQRRGGGRGSPINWACDVRA